tara:strand:+ start:939 stop:1349 length:411 start_codon:yes stop_codon:yes gene_type:complete
VEKTAIDLFKEYYDKIEEFLKFDELNIKEAQMSLASVRHYWVGRLMFHKQEINKLKRLRDRACKKLRQNLEHESPVGLTHKTLTDSVNSHEIIQKVDEELANNELLVEYLTKVESNFRDAQYGMNNLTKIITLETT